MKIVSIEPVKLTLPAPVPKTKPRAKSNIHGHGTAWPIHHYPEFPRAGKFPGDVTGEMWVIITAEDGSWGAGSTHWGDLTAPLIRHHIAPLLVGRDCLAIEYLNDLMWRSMIRFGATGIASQAQSATDVALWDLKGKLLKTPVYSLLGGPCRESIECYITTRDLDWAIELGFKAFKIANNVHHTDGSAGISQLEDFVGAARQTVGPDADLMINPVMSFNVDFGVRLMERLKPYNLRWFEEPLMPWDIEGLSQLKKAVPTLPIATGETHRGRHVFREMVERRAVDILQPDMRWGGGLSEVVKIYTIAEAAGIQTIPHAGGGMAAGQHFAIAMPESPLAEYRITSDPGIPLTEVNRIPGLATPVNGKITLTDAPGFGLELRREDFAPWPG